jgi:cation diffusion facilitator family transporter
LEHRHAHHEGDGHHHPGHHGHPHGVIDPAIASTGRGLSALKWSFAGLFVTAVLQAVVVALSGSVALLADTIHNLADAATAIPLAVAFVLGRRKSTRRFTYGLGRVEDFAGLVIIAIIALSALVAFYLAAQRLVHPPPIEMLWAVMLAGLIGFIGNEGVALLRIRVGRQIGSAALIADGYHARADGLTSLAVVGSGVGVWAGYPLADPVIGLFISGAIFVVVWRASRDVILRMLDGVAPSVVEKVASAAQQIPGVVEVNDVRARWVGHRLHVEVSVTVPDTLSVGMGHEIAKEARHQLLHHLPHLGAVTVHVDPAGHGGEAHHRIGQHAHDDRGVHTHD